MSPLRSEAEKIFIFRLFIEMIKYESLKLFTLVLSSLGFLFHIQLQSNDFISVSTVVSPRKNLLISL